MKESSTQLLASKQHASAKVKNRTNLVARHAPGLVHAKGEGGGKGREGRRWGKMWGDGERREREGGEERGGVIGRGEGRRGEGGDQCFASW